MPIKEMKGLRFGRLLVLEIAGRTRTGQAAWLVLCDCGAKKVVSGIDLRKGTTRSCGCLHDEMSAERWKTHGLSFSRTYRSWASMIQRCGTPRNPSYKNYGARGIKVCERWVGSFENFLADMGERPSGMTLERVDNNVGYEPDNCVWADIAVQANNRRTNRPITALGQTLTVAQWARKQGISESTISDRIRDGVVGDDVVAQGFVLRSRRSQLKRLREAQKAVNA